MWLSNGFNINSPVFAFQTRVVRSEEPEAISFPSGENEMELTERAWLSNGSNTASPVATFQSRMVQSNEPEPMYFPSGENETECTQAVTYKWL